MRFPFEAGPDELTADIDSFVSVVFASLESEFLTLPRGEGFVDYPGFEGAYEVLKRATGGFRAIDASARDRGDRGFEVIACIGGRGFRVRREDMRKLLLATSGKVFTLKTLDRMVTSTALKALQSRS